MSQLYLLHSEFVPASQAIVDVWGDTGPIISEHGACVANAYPLGFQGYPAVLYVDSQDVKHILNLPQTVAEVLAWRDGIEAAYLPPTLDAAKEGACSQIRAATETYILRSHPYYKQINMSRHETIRPNVPPPPVESLYSTSDLMAMSVFIDDARTLCEAACAQVMACTTVEEVSALLVSLASQYPEVLG